MLYEQTDMRIEGRIVVCIMCLTLKSLPQGFDEYMNVVLEEAEEVYLKNKTRRPIGNYI